MRTFAVHFGQSADDIDQKAANQLLESMTSVIGEPGDKAKITDPAPNEDSNKSQTVATEAASNQEKADELTPEQAERINSPEARAAILKAVDAFLKAPKNQGDVLRRGAFITLMTYFEGLISTLMHTFYSLHPSALPANDKTLTLSDLKEIGSIEDAERFLISKEVDTVLRDNLENQLSYFEKRFKLSLDSLSPWLDLLVEIDTRRNIYVHNQGIVNRQYLKRIKRELWPSENQKEGEIAPINAEYLSKAIDIVELVGIMISQHCWRKWEKDTKAIESCNRFFNDVIFDALRDERFALAEDLAKLAEQLPSVPDDLKRITCINRAIALRALNRGSEIPAQLEKFDWTATALKFKLALMVLDDQNDSALTILQKAIAAGDVTKEDWDEWPLFRELRLDKTFSAKVDAIFARELLASTLRQSPGGSNKANDADTTVH